MQSQSSIDLWCKNTGEGFECLFKDKLVSHQACNMDYSVYFGQSKASTFVASIVAASFALRSTAMLRILVQVIFEGLDPVH